MKRALVLIGAILALAGCGSSSSNAERTRLVNKVKTQLQSASLPSDLATCVSQKAHELPISELRTAANSSSADPATKRIGAKLLMKCLDSGHGVAAMRKLIVAQFLAKLPPEVPPAYASCATAKANAITAAQLDQLIAAYASGEATANANAHQFGERLGRECLHQPAVLSALRAVFMGKVTRSFRASPYSRAFQDCVIAKAGRMPAATLEKIAVEPTQARAIGEAFGRAAARACIASGIKP